MEAKKILIIGYSGGIGFSVTNTLLTEGYEVVGTYFERPEREISNKEFTKFGESIDLRDVETIKRLQKSFGGEELYAVVNCAGVVEFEGNDEEENFRIWEKTLAVNLTANYYLARLFYDNLSKNGRFVMISSTDSEYGGDALTASYAASKAGVISLTKSLSLAFKNKKIRVNSISPGWVDTPMIEGESDRFYKGLAKVNPLGRIAKPEDIAKVVKFLLSNDSDYVNGQTITVDGGYTNQDPTLMLEVEEKKN